jgi:pimeloyl-ACP methyl ester carboxylesterase
MDGPHTLAACADDLRHLADHLGIQPRVLIGHSFGGKVVLARAAALPRGLEQVWVLDSRPEVIPAEEIAASDVHRVIQALRQLPDSFSGRQDVVPLLTEQGFSRMLARWMTTNLRRSPSGQWIWRFRLDGVAEMIADYYTTDLRSVLTTPVPDLSVHVVRAERSPRWPPAILRWFDQLPAGAPGQLHLLEDSDHWVHVDNPDGLLAIFDDEL